MITYLYEHINYKINVHNIYTYFIYTNGTNRTGVDFLILTLPFLSLVIIWMNWSYNEPTGITI